MEKLSKKTRAKRDPRERFYEKVKTIGDCHVWQGSKLNEEQGYGRFYFDGIYQLAHRTSFFFTRGYWPALVCHKCNNTMCVRPSHLYDGTSEENADDSILNKGMGRQKLKIKDVREIRNSEKSVGQLALDYEVTVMTIDNILSGKTWARIH